jgi:hypothetical protein
MHGPIAYIIHPQAAIDRASTRRNPVGPTGGVRAPSRGTGAYAILVAMLRLEGRGQRTMSKHAIIPEAQPLCNSDMNQQNAQGFTAWKGVDSLTAKKLVVRRRCSVEVVLQGGGYSLLA